MPNENTGSGLLLNLDIKVLKPLIQAVVSEAISQIQDDSARLGDKLAIGEAEAAQLLSMKSDQLRDERLKGRIQATSGPKGRILYTRQDLIGYLADRRWEKS
jgi:hypothetical protein